jgi:hypothetical protein
LIVASFAWPASVNIPDGSVNLSGLPRVYANRFQLCGIALLADRIGSTLRNRPHVGE